MEKPVKLLTMQETADILRKSLEQMRWMRKQGTGPKSANIGGRILYRESDVYNWINQQFDGK